MGLYALGLQKTSQVSKVARQAAGAPYSLLSEPLQQMSTTSEITEQTFLAIDQKNHSISFPVIFEYKIRVQKILTLENFLDACSSPKHNLEQVLQRLNLGRAETQEKYFKEFLKVIYQFLQLGLLALIFVPFFL